ncbi:MAG: sporulation protein YunB [Oscillospiraceae bacterium]|jgi:sporulation protein YunB|nr:sporulation protein YunB [Oscillospiraceae bacterium]
MAFITLRRIRGRMSRRYRRAFFPRVLLPVIVLSGMIVTVCVTAARAKPIIEMFAKAEAREAVTRAMNDAVAEQILAGQISYERIVRVAWGEDGTVTALITDTAQVNLMQTAVSNAINENVVNIMNSDLSIPVGDVFGGVLFSGRGPGIPVRIQSVADVHAEFRNSFEDAGINQTRHRIDLWMTAQISIIIPGGTAKTSVSAEIPIAETVIVGNVPSIYSGG